MKDTVTFHCAFEDDEGWYVDPKVFTKDAAISAAEDRNKRECDRLKGKGKPDAVWVVVKAETTWSVVASPGIPTKPKKVIRRRSLKSK